MTRTAFAQEDERWKLKRVFQAFTNTNCLPLIVILHVISHAHNLINCFAIPLSQNQIVHIVISDGSKTCLVFSSITS
jgi:hypothetical protein